MNIIKIQVPDYVEHISDWVGYELPDGRCIVDKDICGCGYTEFCIRPQNRYDTILCSPRIALLEDKYKQHPGEPNILYIENKGLRKNFADSIKITEDKIKEHNKEFLQYLDGIVKSHVFNCRSNGVPIRILCTYDSFHTILLLLKNQIDLFHVVVDEMQSIWEDSFYKADVEHSFFECLKTVPNVVYLSATPMLDKYLEELEEFRYLPYYKLVWPQDKITYATVNERQVNDPVQEVIKIINTYKNKPLDRPWKIIGGQVIYSEEVVFYVNSIRMINSIITKAKLEPQECNIICANNKANKTLIGKIRKKDLPRSNRFEIGEIPLEDEYHKMFTFCTRTAYLGADFYSKTAQTVIVSDANICSLVLDIRLDLPQILGRQRLKTNPWKNECIVFYTTLSENGKEITEEKFMEYCSKKRQYSTNLIGYYDSRTTDAEREYMRDALFPSRAGGKSRSSEDNHVDQGSFKYYLSVNYAGKIVVNPFLESSERRAWELIQKHYTSRISVIKSIEDNKYTNLTRYTDANDTRVQMVINKINDLARFDYKFRCYCEVREAYKDDLDFTEKLLSYYSGSDMENYYSHFGIDVCRSVGYQALDLKKKLHDESILDPLKGAIYNEFKVGEKYSLKEIKAKLTDIYLKCGVYKNPKATDLLGYFKVSECKYRDQDSKRVKYYKIISYS